jgi:cytochrome c biogenesis protein CcmG, thiol:disulfide interchange protein DsbE
MQQHGCLFISLYSRLYFYGSMKSTTRPFPFRSFVIALVGIQLILIGVMLVIRFNQPPASSQKFSAIPLKSDFRAPELNLQDISANPISLNNYVGSVLLVNLWATWCVPCTEELPALQSFYEKYKANGFVLIGINEGEPIEAIKPFVNDFDLTFPIWIDEDLQAEREFNTFGLPSSFVIDRNGQVILRWAGVISSENLEKYVSPIILE